MRFAQAVRAEQRAADQLGQQVAPLRLGAEVRDRRAGEGVHADAESDAGPPDRQLLEHLQVDLVGLAAAAHLLGEGQAEQAGVPQDAEDLAGEPLLPLVGRRLRRQLGVGQLAGQREEVGGLLGGQLTLDAHGSSRWV